jgi:hypothetical protein
MRDSHGQHKRRIAEKGKVMDAQMAVAIALLETIKEAGPLGAPSGPMYLACNQSGIDLDSYEAMMRALVKTGLVRHENHVYYWQDAAS